jgi:uncharacterized membrane protein YkoI
MTYFRTILITMAAAAALSFGAAMPAHAAQKSGNCLSDQQIQADIASGKILSWPKIKRIAGISEYAEVSDVKVCTVNGVPYYTVNIVSPNGEAKKIVLNAVDGSA